MALNPRTYPHVRRKQAESLPLALGTNLAKVIDAAPLPSLLAEEPPC
jgi:hypothetical protein